MRKTVTPVAAALVAVALGAIAFASVQRVSAQGPGRGFGPGGPGGPALGPGARGPLGALMLGRLDLTADQRDRVKQILDAYRDEQRTLATRAVAAHDALQGAISAPFDEAAIRARAADVAAVEADQAVARARIYGEVLQMLSAEQQAKLKTMQEERKKRLDERRAHRAQKRRDRL